MTELKIGDKVCINWQAKFNRHLRQKVGKICHINPFTPREVKVEYLDRPAVWIETNKIRLVST